MATTSTKPPKSRTPKKPKRKVYAVAEGNEKGIFETWEECNQNVKGFKGAVYKSFSNRDEAQKFLDQHENEKKETVGGNNGQFENEKKKTGSGNKSNNFKRSRSDEKKVEKKQIPPPFPYIVVAMVVMFDGGSRGNPHGKAGAGAVVEWQHSQILQSSSDTKFFANKQTIKMRQFLGYGSFTNNQAEYQGLCMGLLCAVQETKKLVESLLSSSALLSSPDGENPRTNVLVQLLVQGDSQLVIFQMRDEYQCRHANLKPFHKLAKEFEQELQNWLKPFGDERAVAIVRYNHVGREFNSLADELGNQAMDAERSWKTVVNEEGDEGLPEEYDWDHNKDEAIKTDFPST